MTLFLQTLRVLGELGALALFAWLIVVLSFVWITGGGL